MVVCAWRDCDTAAMISGLDHINIRTSDLDRLCKFYVDVLGMEVGERPSFDVPGAWIYAGGQAVLHVVVTNKPARGNTQPVDHFALNAHGCAAIEKRLQKAKSAYRVADVPGRAMKQIFVSDPDGVSVELNFTDTKDVSG